MLADDYPCAHSAHPSWSPTDDTIAFVRRNSDYASFDVFTVGVDGTHLIRVTHAPPFDDSVNQDPDFAKACEGQASACQQVAERNIEPSWSPDGRRIVFASNRASQGDEQTRYALFTAAADGTDLEQLTQPPRSFGPDCASLTADDIEPVW